MPPGVHVLTIGETNPPVRTPASQLYPNTTRYLRNPMRNEKTQRPRYNQSRDSHTDERAASNLAGDNPKMGSQTGDAVEEVTATAERGV